ncbi:hypothetical protein QNN00_03930 [Bacillus velezensis]|nr:hypothetical protein [Bacillus velezensis]
MKKGHAKGIGGFKDRTRFPVIPRLYEYGDRYIVMEYVQGTSLARHIRKEKSLSVKLTADILNMLDELKESVLPDGMPKSGTF